MTHAKIVNLKGSPSISINGKIFPPVMATIRTIDGDHLIMDEEYFRCLGESGIKLFYIICDTEWLKPNSFSLFQSEAELLLKNVPDAYIFVRIGLHPPVQWCNDHPDDMMQYSDGISKGMTLFSESYVNQYPAMYSLCSQRWREDAGAALLNICRKIDNLPFSDRIVGFFFAAGGTSEWYYVTPTEYSEKNPYLDTGGWEQEANPGLNNVYGDLSPAFRQQFRNYLTAKYNSDKALQVAWKDDSVTLQTPSIPDSDNRYYVHGVDYDLSHPEKIRANSPDIPAPCNGTNIGHFLDIDHHQDVYDFYRAWADGTAESIIYFGNLVKKYSPERLTGAFYGSAGCCLFHSFGTIGSVEKILHSDAIDFLAAPPVYENRQPGGFSGIRENNDSFRLHNKIYVVEDDVRTHMENRYFQNYFEVYDINDSINLLKREFGRTICNNMYSWWFDQLLGGKRYKHPEIYKLFAKQQQIAHDAYSGDRAKISEIALIFDEDSYHVISHESNHQMVELFVNYEVDKIGAPVDRYFKDDLFNPDMPEYKLYIFMNDLCFTDHQRCLLQKKLKKNHATALFMYASGVINFDSENKYDSQNVTKTTGIQMSISSEAYHGKFKISDIDHPILKRLDRGEIYGDFTRKMWANASSFMGRIKTSEVILYPLIYSDDSDAVVLGSFLDSHRPALTLKELQGYVSIYCASKYLSCDVVREIARFAGCHIFIETGDVLYANKEYITLHASQSGNKVVKLPEICTIEEVYENKVYAEHARQINVSMLKGETKMFSIQNERG